MDSTHLCTLLTLGVVFFSTTSAQPYLRPSYPLKYQRSIPYEPGYEANPIRWGKRNSLYQDTEDAGLWGKRQEELGEGLWGKRDIDDVRLYSKRVQLKPRQDPEIMTTNDISDLLERDNKAMVESLVKLRLDVDEALRHFNIIEIQEDKRQDLESAGLWG
ncbi:uncharacterized protein [Clytia hemisphaerica]|uniref:Uncharacterized protein n=1 Tax=Clytia hemisphaerica TaxID=252671 RepID=A0A7M5V480_9CNID